MFYINTVNIAEFYIAMSSNTTVLTKTKYFIILPSAIFFLNRKG